MTINADTLRALQIFHYEVHPSQMGIGPHKEGLSVFGLLDRTKSSVGKKMLRAWMRRPSLSLSVIHERQSTIEFFLSPDLSSFCGELSKNIKKVRDVSKLVMRVRSVAASVNDWIGLYETLKSLHRILDISYQIDDSLQPPNVIKQLQTSITPPLLHLLFLLEDVFDWNESKIINRLTVNCGIDDDLDEKRANFEGLPDFLTSIASRVLDTDIDFDVLLTVEFVPQIGYLIVTPNDETVARVSNVEGMEFLFNTASQSFWKNPLMRELDEKLGDIHGAIIDMEIAIVREVEKKVFELSPPLLVAVDFVAQLDCLLSLTSAAYELGLVKPIVIPRPNPTENGAKNKRMKKKKRVERLGMDDDDDESVVVADDDQGEEMIGESIIEIKGGKHPLQELVVDTFIPNDTKMGGDFKPMHIITGANYSGKSVYMKQVGIIVYLAHLGSFVPAEAARVTLTDKILTRIFSKETFSVSCSTFMIDLKQISNILQNCTPSSLVLIDEFGKGTNSTDGIALLSATIRYLLTNYQKCPLTIVVTHFNELFSIPGVLPLPTEKRGKKNRFRALIESEDDESDDGGHNKTTTKRRVGDDNNGKEDKDDDDSDDSDDDENNNNSRNNNDIFEEEGEGGELIAFGHMAVLDSVPSTSAAGVGDVTFLYRLEDGIADASFGFHCALMAGIPPPLVERGRVVARKLQKGREINPLTDFDNASKEQDRELVQMLMDFDVDSGDVADFLERIRKM